MKKLILLSAGLLMINSVIAQQSKFEIGLGAGVNITNVSGFDKADSIIQDKSKNFSGIRIYSLLGYRFSKNLILLFEPGFEQKGFKTANFFVLDTNNVIIPGDLLYISNYYDFPLTLNLVFGKMIQLHAGAGGYVGVLESAKIKVKPANADVKAEDIDYTSSYSSLDYGVLIRASVVIQLGSWLGIEAGVNYSKGIADISEDNNGISLSLKNHSIYAGAGVRFFLAGKTEKKSSR